LCGRSTRALRVAAIVVLCAFPRAAKAQASVEDDLEVETQSTSTDYDKLLDRAVEAFEAQDYKRARELFEQAYAIRPNARVLRGLGISALHLERFTISKSELTQALREPKQPLTATQREGVTELLSWMQVNLGTLQLHLNPAKALATLDDEPVTDPELVVKPGTHRVVVSAEGFKPEERAVVIAAGQDKTLSVTLTQTAEDSAPMPNFSVTDVTLSAWIAGGNASLRSADDPPLLPAADRDSGSVLKTWWFWTAVGVVVAGGVATTIALTSTPAPKSYEKGGLGGVIKPLGWAP
jgi:tetratricopeptide (TPR) repeat protein